MTSFRISKGIEKDLPTTKTDGRMYFCTDTGNIYIDYKDGSTVSRKLINKDSLDKKLNLTGGTISGKLTFSGTSADTANLAFSREGYNYITFPSGGNLALATSASDDGIIVGISNVGMYPYSNNAKTLGTSDKKWSNVYATNFTGSGASLTSLNASNISSGTLSSDRLPTIPIAKGGTGATTAAGALTNLGITATAAELNKLDGVTATTAELNYVDGVTSNIQTQLNAKQANITGAATSIASSNLTASRALVSDSSGKVAVSAVTSTELGYLDGVTSAIQTQLNGKVAKTGDTMTGQLRIHCSNPHLELKDSSYDTIWYIQAYQDTVAFGSTYANAVKTDKNGNMTVPGTVYGSVFKSGVSESAIKPSDSNEINFGSNTNFIYFGYNNRVGSTGRVDTYKFGTHSGVDGATSGNIECGTVKIGNSKLVYDSTNECLNFTF